jgi:RNA polymerase sigma-70 factor (sigma-E family)
LDRHIEAAYREFVTARSADLFRRAYVLVDGDAHAADDLLQIALAKLAGRWSRVSEPAAYVRKIMYRELLSWHRRARHRMESLRAEPPERAQADPAGGVDTRLVVRAALARLGPRQRAVLILRHFEDLNEAETADVLGCSVGTVRSTNHRALRRLREIAPELDPNLSEVFR